jgi:hypothetical protein
VWKTNLVLEELARQKGRKYDQREGSREAWSTFEGQNDPLNLNHQTVHDILTEELGMRKICAHLVPKNLTNKQKKNWRNVYLDLLERIKNDENIFKPVITGNE